MLPEEENQVEKGINWSMFTVHVTPGWFPILDSGLLFTPVPSEWLITQRILKIHQEHGEWL